MSARTRRIVRGEPDPPSPPDDFVACNCAGCGEMISSDVRRETFEVQRIAGRIHGRPFCGACLIVAPKSAGSAGTTKGDEAGPWHENAVRALEGD